MSKNRTQKLTDERGSGPWAKIRALFGGKGYVPIKTGNRAGTTFTEERFPEPPPAWTGTLPEWAVYWGHTKLGLKDGEDFVYLYPSPIGTPGIKGSYHPIDFFELDIHRAIEVFGLYWHYMFSSDTKAHDIERWIALEAAGIPTVFIDEDDALADPVYYVSEARLGRDHSLRGMGLA
jgi:hypothetical protein